MNEKWFYVYRVRAEEDGHKVEFSGVVVGSSYADAAKEIEKYYGPDLVEILWLACTSFEGVMELSNDIVNDIWCGTYIM